MKVGIIMGSTSDYEVMSGAEEMLKSLEIPFEKKVVSAHRTPDLMYEYAKTAKERGISVIIAGAGGAAHLPGMVAAMTTLPVIGVPVKSRALNGLDSLLSIVQMPGGVPVATVAINGAKNAALIAASILALQSEDIARRLEKFRQDQTDSVLKAEIQLLGDAPRKPHTMFFQFPCRRSAQEWRHIRLMTLSTSLLLLERSRMALKL